MTTKEDAIREWKQLWASKAETQIIRFALTGDGSDASTADVANRIGWAWVRYDEEQSKASQVRNRVFPGIAQDVPVVIGKRYPTDRDVQILGINEPLYELRMNQDQRFAYLTPPHGQTHHAILGTDPAEIDIANILNGKVRANEPATMGVYVEPFSYYYRDQRKSFGGTGVDLSNCVPGTENYQRYVLISFDTIEERVKAIKGLSSPNTVPPTPPSVPIWHSPLGLVQVYYGMTAVTVGYIHEYRMLFHPIGAYQTYRNLMQVMEYYETVWIKHLAGEM